MRFLRYADIISSGSKNVVILRLICNKIRRLECGLQVGFMKINMFEQRKQTGLVFLEERQISADLSLNIKTLALCHNYNRLSSRKQKRHFIANNYMS